MHYKNGRPANNGDKVVLIPSYGAPVIGILYDAVAGNGTCGCNGRLAPCSPTDLMPNLAQCLHFDDVVAADKAGLIKDSTVSATPAPASSGGLGAALAILLFIFALCSSATAQVPKVGYIPLTGLPQSAVAGTSNVVVSLGQLQFQQMEIISTSWAPSPGYTNIYYIAYSPDGITFDTNLADCSTVTNKLIAGALATNTVDNGFSVSGHCYGEICAVTYSGPVTNGTIRAGQKISCP